MLQMIQVSNTMYTTVCLTEKKNKKYIKRLDKRKWEWWVYNSICMLNWLSCIWLFAIPDYNLPGYSVH